MLETIASYIWSAGLLVLLLGTGVFLTIRLRFLQFRGWRTILKRTFGSLKEKPAGENRTALTSSRPFPPPWRQLWERETSSAWRRRSV